MPSTAHAIKPYTLTWTEKQLGHLLRRTLFGMSQKDLAFFKGKSMEQCVEILTHSVPVPPPPVFHSPDDPVVPEGTSFVFAPYNKARDEDWTIYVRAQWIGQMVNPQQNMAAKMVLFWHNHFVIQFNNVKDSRYAYNYLHTIQKHATGNFKTLLREITTSPGMLVYLNGNQNSKTNPNENYGRELQELFTIGKGPNSHYTEADVKAAGKVLTGWKDDKLKINSYFDSNNHNTSDKTFSAFYSNHVIKGKAGTDGAKETDELIDMICAQTEVSKFLCRKLYRWFVHSHIDAQVEENVIEPLAEIMRQSNYEVKPVLKALLSGAFFYDEKLIGAMFKSPADYFIGITREINFEIRKNKEGWFLLSEAITAMGQDIGNPPTVAGWPAYYEFPSYDRNWVNSEYLSQRNRFKDFTFDGFNPPADPFIVVDYLPFVKQFLHPENPNKLIEDMLGALCTIQPGTKQIAFLQTLLNGDKDKLKPWQQLWSVYKSNPNDTKGKKELNDRLSKVFDVILLMPEYQIM